MQETKVLLGEITAGQQDKRLTDIYVDDKVISYQKERYEKAILKFEELYGAGEAEIYSAPGRSEVWGNHTDHQHGEVLAASINTEEGQKAFDRFIASLNA
ncbi:MAG: galactokinase family protein [Clostridiales bacterium]|nr:galactokinase family protein [Clostridiales bacterium]